MPVSALQHFNLRPYDMEATKDFYVDLVGLEVGERPPLGFPGYWLYGDGVALVHLYQSRPGEGPVPPLNCDDERKTGYLDHLAFAARGLAEYKAKLDAAGIIYRLKVVPNLRQTQLFFFDPNGLQVELVFDASETIPA